MFRNGDFFPGSQKLTSEDAKYRDIFLKFLQQQGIFFNSKVAPTDFVDIELTPDHVVLYASIRHLKDNGDRRSLSPQKLEAYFKPISDLDPRFTNSPIKSSLGPTAGYCPDGDWDMNKLIYEWGAIALPRIPLAELEAKLDKTNTQPAFSQQEALEAYKNGEYDKIIKHLYTAQPNLKRKHSSFSDPETGYSYPKKIYLKDGGELVENHAIRFKIPDKGVSRETPTIVNVRKRSGYQAFQTFSAAVDYIGQLGFPTPRTRDYFDTRDFRAYDDRFGAYQVKNGQLMPYQMPADGKKTQIDEGVTETGFLYFVSEEEYHTAQKELAGRLLARAYGEGPLVEGWRTKAQARKRSATTDPSFGGGVDV